MLKKLLQSLLGNRSSSRPHRKFSSSDHKHKNGYGHSHGHGNSYYGSSHYKKKRSSRSFFSS